VRPFVSVLVPVRDEERYIERCLYSLARQDYPRPRVEVIVVDGGSHDMTRQLIGRFAAESTVDVRLLDNPAGTPAAAMHIGLDHARGEIIVRLDGHAYAPPDFLSRSVSVLLETGADCAGGALEQEGDSYTGRAIAIAMSSRFGVGGSGYAGEEERGQDDQLALRDLYFLQGRYECGPDEAITAEWLLDHCWIVGDPDEVARRLRALHTQVGGFGSVLQLIYDWGDDQEKNFHSMELLANRVLPQLVDLD